MNIKVIGLVSGIFFTLALDMFLEVVLFTPSVSEIWLSVSVVRPVVVILFLIVIFYSIPGYFIAWMWGKDELFASTALALVVTPMIAYLSHIRAGNTGGFAGQLDPSQLYIYASIAIAIIIGGILRAETK